MRDLTLEQSALIDFVEHMMCSIALQYGYQSIHFPILESLSLFQKSIGIETDIVGQEMYAFKDKNDETIALRPEGTAGCLRASLANSLIQRQKQKLFYTGPMFRRERPQRGRFRQFQQFGVEVYGYPSGLIDAELILMSQRIWEELELDNITLEVNYLGSPASRQEYHRVLSEYWEKHMDKLTDAEKQRAKENPLRLLDSKNPELADIIHEAPAIFDSLSDDEKACYASILKQLDVYGIEYIESHRLVRGLDYYSDFIFEWVSADLGAQSTICGGGRYDPLVKSMGEDIAAAGFAIGIDRVAELISESPQLPIRVSVCGKEPEHLLPCLIGLENIRHEYAIINIDPTAGKIKSKINAAKQDGADFIAIISDSEVKLISISDDNATQMTLTEFYQWYLSLSEGE